MTAIPPQVRSAHAGWQPLLARNSHGKPRATTRVLPTRPVPGFGCTRGPRTDNTRQIIGCLQRDPSLHINRKRRSSLRLSRKTR